MGYIDALRTVRVALVASCTMACLAELRYAAVITDEEGAAGFAIVLIPAAFGYIALVDAAVVMQQNGGNVQSVGTRHKEYWDDNAPLLFQEEDSKKGRAGK